MMGGWVQEGMGWGVEDGDREKAGVKTLIRKTRNET